MSCDHSTYCSAIELVPDANPTIEAGDHDPRKTDLEPEQSRDQGRVRLTAKTELQGQQVRSRFIPDSTETDPEYVWGDEGPIND